MLKYIINMSDPATQMSGEVERVPDFLRLGKVPVNYLQQLETDLLDPVVFNEGSGATTDGFCRFTLQPKGFLHSHSKLFVSLIPAAAVSQAIFPANIGVGSVIKKAVLKVGNKVINEISDWDYLHALKSAHISNENNVERELYTTGRFVNHAFVYDAGENDNASTYSLDVGRNINGGDINMLPFADMDGNTAATRAESPTYAIDLSDLFPFLKVHQLPLYMITEPINIELTFRPPQNNRVVRVTGTPLQEFLIDRNELKFCADYIFYGSGDEMARYAEQNQSMSFSFTDHRMISTSVSQASLASETVRNIGMASRQVNKVITMFNPPRANEETLLQGVSAEGSTADVSGGANNGKVEALSYNLRYNDKFEFSSNITNSARLFNLLQDTEGVIFITRDEFNSGGVDGGIEPTITFASKVQRSDLQGAFFFNATRLTGGRVGTRGIEIHVKFDSIHTEVDTMRNFCEYLRVAQLQNGEFTIFNV